MSRDDLQRSIGRDGPDSGIPNMLINRNVLVGTHQVHQHRNHRETRMDLNVLLRRLKLYQAQGTRTMGSEIVRLGREMAGQIGEVKSSSGAISLSSAPTSLFNIACRSCSSFSTACA